jgi:hypothetical protein
VKYSTASFGMYLSLLPRVVATYPFYILSGFLLSSDVSHIKRYFLISCSIFFVLISHVLIVGLFYKTSITATILEFSQILPMFLLLFCPFYGWDKTDSYIHKFNGFALFFSIVNIVVFYDFPFKLPYIDFLPDAFAGFWGSGGAKLVTILGFMGLLSCYFYKQPITSVATLVSLFNFIAPSYNIGIAAGVLAFAVVLLMSLSARRVLFILFLALILAVFLLPYLMFRIGELNMLFLDQFGMIPKLYAYYNIYLLFQGNPDVFIFGAGLGNVSGTASLWASDYISEISANQAMNLPGLFESEMHLKYLGDPLSIVELDRWAISSSINKPYSTFTTLIMELGFFTSLLVFIRFFYVIHQAVLNRNVRYIFLIFVFLIFLVDNMHANPLFWIIICLGLRGIININDDGELKR